MRIVASACLVIAILFMVGCGTSAEDKKAIQDQGTKLTALDTRVGTIEKMAPDMAKKMDVVWNYLVANPIGKAKFPPDSLSMTKTTTTTNNKTGTTTTNTTTTTTPTQGNKKTPTTTPGTKK
jgi:hypothetical protein